MASPAQLKANAKYLQTLDRVVVRVPKGEKDKYKAFAESQGKSLNALVVELLEASMNAAAPRSPSLEG